MPLRGRYSAGNIRELLIKLPHASPQGERQPTLHNCKVYTCFETNNAIILDAASDYKNSEDLHSIETAFDRIAEEISFSEEQKNKKIIIPVAEEQYILGLISRRHWVTLYYDPVENKATLLDSRPQRNSFLYPTGEMLDMLKKGLQYIYPSDVIDKMTFEKIYQNVQYNDIYCGTWTMANILGLTGIDLLKRQSRQPHTIGQQSAIFIPENEQNLLESFIKLAKGEITFTDASDSNTDTEDEDFNQEIAEFVHLEKPEKEEIVSQVSPTKSTFIYSILSSVLPGQIPDEEKKVNQMNSEEKIIKLFAQGAETAERLEQSTSEESGYLVSNNLSTN